MSGKTGRLILTALAAAILSVAALLLCACGGEDNAVRLEAEQAVVVTATDSPVSVLRDKTRNKEHASDGKYVAALNGSISWVFETDGGAAELGLRLRSEKRNVSAGALCLTFNGKKMELAEAVISDEWTRIEFGVTAVAGYNTVTLTTEDTELDVDYLDIDTSVITLSPHVHDWRTEIKPATCTRKGAIERVCKDCGYSYVFTETDALGHSWGNYRFDAESGKMMRVCGNDLSHREYSVVESRYFGEVYDTEEKYSVRPYELKFEAEDANVDIRNGGLNHGTSYIEEVESASGGLAVGNISNIGNFVVFEVEAETDLKADLVFVCANVLYTDYGIGELDPLGRYMRFTVNGMSVDFGFVSFPGNVTYDYYDWHYVVMKNIDLVKGVNRLVYQPITQRSGTGGKTSPWVTVPNLDALLIYTDERGTVRPIYRNK